MEHEPTRPSRARENMLAVALTIAAGGAIYFFLDLVTMGLMTVLLAGAVLLAVVISVHYLAWGRAFMDEVAVEREHLRRQDEREAQKKPQAGAFQDISRTQGIKK
jgi:hypothetical protein